MLTVIVPIYKVELYIEKCVRSLMEQTVKDDIEFLFINDCTPDRSMDILNDVIKEYPERKEQIAIINNDKNLGIAETRIKALKYAKGDYVGWCDSDDWCEPNMFENLIKGSNHFTKDIVVCDFFMIKKGKIIECKHGSTDDPKEAVAGLCINDLFPYQLWETIIRKDLIENGFSKIAPTMSGEDCYAEMIAFYHARSIAYVHKTLYHHRILDTSLTNNIVMTKEEWNAQKYNIKYIKNLYGNKTRFREAWLKWEQNRKVTYISTFDSLWEFYLDFPEIEFYSIKRCNKPRIRKVIMLMVFAIYPLYWLQKRKYWKRNRLEMFWG